MSSRINLNDNVENTFQFTLGGLDYDFVYPTMAEAQSMNELYKDRAKLEKKDDEQSAATLEALDETIVAKLYDFIKPVGHSTPIKETLDKQTLPVVKKFNKLVIGQLSSD